MLWGVVLFTPLDTYTHIWPGPLQSKPKLALASEPTVFVPVCNLFIHYLFVSVTKVFVQSVFFFFCISLTRLDLRPLSCSAGDSHSGHAGRESTAASPPLLPSASLVIFYPCARLFNQKAGPAFVDLLQCVIPPTSPKKQKKKTKKKKQWPGYASVSHSKGIVPFFFVPRGFIIKLYIYLQMKLPYID